MKCNYCGREIPESYDFCDNCGAKLEKTNITPETAATVEPPTVPDQTPPVSYQPPADSYQAPPSFNQTPPPQYSVQPPAYQNPRYYGEELAPVVSMGHWMLITFLLCIPIANIVLILVWSFSKNTNPNQRNYSRAVLIWMLIVTAIYIVIFIVAGVSLFDQLSYY